MSMLAIVIKGGTTHAWAVTVDDICSLNVISFMRVSRIFVMLHGERYPARGGAVKQRREAG